METRNVLGFPACPWAVDSSVTIFSLKQMCLAPNIKQYFKEGRPPHSLIHVDLYLGSPSLRKGTVGSPWLCSVPPSFAGCCFSSCKSRHRGSQVACLPLNLWWGIVSWQEACGAKLLTSRYEEQGPGTLHGPQGMPPWSTPFNQILLPQFPSLSHSLSDYECINRLIHPWGQSPHDPVVSQKPRLWTSLHGGPNFHYTSPCRHISGPAIIKRLKNSRPSLLKRHCDQVLLAIWTKRGHEQRSQPQLESWSKILNWGPI